jgi:hypothetical protein
MTEKELLTTKKAALKQVEVIKRRLKVIDILLKEIKEEKDEKEKEEKDEKEEKEEEEKEEKLHPLARKRMHGRK